MIMKTTDELGRNRLSTLMFSSASNEWATPQDLFDALHAEFRFTLDPCSTHENAKCKNHFTIEENGLAQDWGKNRVFMNPPYGRQIGVWMQKAHESCLSGALVVCLVPSRTDTIWWHSFAAQYEVRFIRGRIKFNGHKNCAPFPSAGVIMNPKNAVKNG